LKADQNPYSLYLDLVQKPARYIGGEHFSIKKDWEKIKAKVALCFPDTYEIGMSHLGYKILYDELNQHKDILAERCFTPWLDMENLMRENHLDLVSLESFKPLKEFDLLGFSLQYEMSYTNILNMLDLGGVEVLQKDRKETDPIIICGGPCATHPEPLADFVDLFVIGDGEDVFKAIALYIGIEKNKGVSKSTILEHLATWKGVYVPQFYEVEQKDYFEIVTGPKANQLGVVQFPIQRFTISDLNKYPFPTKSPIPHLTAIFDRFAVELARGCTEGCRFCQAGMIYRPVRERSPKDVVSKVMEGIKNGGFDEASLTCLSTADYSAVTPLILELLDQLKEDRSSLGISSLRAYGLDEKIFDKLAAVKNTSLTFAPEAGTQRMRNVINKNVSEKDLMKTAENVFSRGWKKMKLYFMIGLPTETDEDVLGIMETAKLAKNEAKKCGVHNSQITVSVSSFVPKPHTPFQWAPMISLEEINRKQNLLFGYSKRYGLNFRKHESRVSVFEGLVARGDRKIGKLIHLAWSRGARFDGWNEGFKYDLWIQAVSDLGINLSMYLNTIPLDVELPWNHIDIGLHERFLVMEWKKATKSKLSLPCGKVAGMIVHHSDLTELEKTFDIDKKRLVCYNCGVECDLKGMVEERRDYLTEMKEPEAEEVVVFENENIPSVETPKLPTPASFHFRYRISFEKLGPMSFISHLDLQKVMHRIFKRADIKIAYSKGFRPRPLFSFGPALSLGISSFNEYFEVKTMNKWDDLENYLSKLQMNSENGIFFNQIQEMGNKDSSIQQATVSHEYFFPTESTDSLDERISDYLKQDSIKVEKIHHKTKKVRTYDLKDYITGFEKMKLLSSDDKWQLVDQVSPCIGLDGIKLKIKVDNGQTIGPNDLKKHLNDLGFKTYRPIKIASKLEMLN
jgi:radical SAM family uncharacterized protein/radical SAM-linked protein